MKKMHLKYLLGLFLLATPSWLAAQRVASYRCVPAAIRIYWKAADGQPYASFSRLVAAHPKIRFAMNGGMYARDLSPVGLYVEGGRQLKAIRRVNNPKVNFGIQPQGIFCIRSGKAFVETLAQFKAKGVTYATQS
ncbi:MAG: hypothetical protein EOP50_08030, partial [Sphingobacteriales bacterium]